MGDALVASVIAGLAEHLEPGGIAQLLGNWEYGESADGLDRVRDWVASTGLDAWVVEREVQDAALYSETWIRDGGTRPGPEFDGLYGAWLDDFEQRGVTSVGFGYLTLRASSQGLRRLERLDGALNAAAGEASACTSPKPLRHRTGSLPAPTRSLDGSGWSWLRMLRRSGTTGRVPQTQR